jgi:uncharacterized membrane protein YqgA involved in biofilm formation
MIGLGTLVNVSTIIAGSCLGLVLRNGLPKKWQETIIYGVGISVIVIGLQMALKSNNLMIVILSLVFGIILGEIINIENRLNKLGEFLGKKVSKGKKLETTGKAQNEVVANAIAEGFVTATLIYCIGAMAIIGAINDGLRGDYSVLFAKSILDGIVSIILTANLGIGVAFSAISVGVYQGILTLLASALGPFMTDSLITEISATGGVMIVAIGFNMIKITKIRIANMLPGILFVPIVMKFLQFLLK